MHRCIWITCNCVLISGYLLVGVLYEDDVSVAELVIRL